MPLGFYILNDNIILCEVKCVRFHSLKKQCTELVSEQNVEYLSLECSKVKVHSSQSEENKRAYVCMLQTAVLSSKKVQV